MSRHQLQNPAPMLEILPARAADIVNAQDALAIQTAATATLAAELGYDGSLTVGALEDGIRFYQQRTAEACIELGKRLLLLKETCAHGDFKPRLELLGIEYRTAHRFMSVADKFAKVSTVSLLKVANNRAKLLELVVLDDEEVAELADGGTVRGMAADDVANMGVRELRKALREAKAEAKANDELLGKKSAKIDQLEREKKRIQEAPASEVDAELQTEATLMMKDALGAVRGKLRQAIKALQARAVDTGEDNTLFMAGLVGQVQADLTKLREEFSLPDVSNAADAELAAEVAEWSKD